MNNDVWVYENGLFIGTLNTNISATTTYAIYSVEDATANQLKIDLILKNSKGLVVSVVVQLSSGILSITPLTIPEAFRNKVVSFFRFYFSCPYLVYSVYSLYYAVNKSRLIYKVYLTLFIISS